MKTATARVSIQRDVKERAESILHELGLSVSGALDLFCRQIILNKKLPFDAKTPNETTRKAITESRTGMGKKLDSVNELFEDLGI